MDQVLFKIAGEENQKNWDHLDNYKLSDRTLRDIDLGFSMTLSPTKTKEENLIYLLPENLMVAPMLFDSRQRTLNTFLSEKISATTKHVLHGVKFANPEKAECLIYSSWLDASRIIDVGKTDTIITDSINYKKSVLTKQEMGSTDFELAQGRLARCFSHVIIPLAKNPSDVTALNQREVDVDKLLDESSGNSETDYRAYDLVMRRSNRNPTDAKSLAQLSRVVLRTGLLCQ